MQLGTLKAFLESDSNFKVRAFHPYLEVSHVLGSEIYHLISLESWISEALYSAVLFPEKRDSARNLVNNLLKKNRLFLDFDTVWKRLDTHLRKWVDSIEWSQFQLVGFSVCFNQLISSLAAASAIKKKYPSLPVVFGGSSCIPDMAAGLFDHFSIDYMISGEGEQALFNLCKCLHGNGNELDKRVYSKEKHGEGQQEIACQIDMAQLPFPVYDDYFDEMNTSYANQPFIPTIPVEFSRGCWWGKCAFCNLNLQWKGYRSKSTARMLEEVTWLSQKYESLDFTFTDNVLPYKEAETFFQEMKHLNKNFLFFGEIRANMGGSYLDTCKKGGLNSIQVGIEGLSQSLLKRLKKGSTVIENIAIMRDAAAYGVMLDGNLIIEFPGSTEEDVDETLRVLDFLFPFHPLTTASFFLGHASPVYYDHRQFGISAVVSHPNIKKLIPEKILCDLPILVKGFRGDRQYQRKIWGPVRKKVKRWQNLHAKNKKEGKPLLSMRDGGDFLVIRQKLENGEVLHHRLRGVSRKVYLSCCQGATLTLLSEQFPALTIQRIQTFMKDLVGKKIVFQQGDSFLALALPIKL